MDKTLDFFLFVYSNLRFQTQYGVRAQTALPYSMNSEFSRVLASQMVNNAQCPEFVCHYSLYEI